MSAISFLLFPFLFAALKLCSFLRTPVYLRRLVSLKKTDVWLTARTSTRHRGEGVELAYRTTILKFQSTKIELLAEVLGNGYRLLLRKVEKKGNRVNG
jgi:hypothetical protein